MKLKQKQKKLKSCGINTKPVKVKLRTLTKIFNEKEVCANTGADGRKTDLEGHLHTVEIGFQFRDRYEKYVRVFE